MFKMNTKVNKTWIESVEKTELTDAVDVGNIYISTSDKVLTVEITFKNSKGVVIERKPISIAGEVPFNDIMAQNPIIAAGIRKLSIDLAKESGLIAKEACVDLMFGNASPEIVIPESVKTVLHAVP